MYKHPGLTFARNRGELAEGWYRPQTSERAEAFVADSPPGATEAGINASGTEERATNVDTSSDDDMPGPVLPGNTIPSEGRNRRSGPTIPNFQDLELQQGKARLARIYGQAKSWRFRNRYGREP